MALKSAVKRSLRRQGYKIEKINPLEESIPVDYNHSPSLPRVYRGALDRYLYFKDKVEKVRTVERDIVECGVSIGHGALLFTLFSDYVGVPRTYYGFDSFEGFPEPVEKDETTPIKGKGFGANPPDTVLKVLRDGRLNEDVIREPGGAIIFDDGDARWSGATKAIDEIFSDKPETIRPHPKCTWKFHVVKQ